jgi:hypothetical protein
MAAVRQVAQMGVTAAAVIHQPSYQVFSMFDDVILLAKGGRTAYYGLAAGVQVRSTCHCCLDFHCCTAMLLQLQFHMLMIAWQARALRLRTANTTVLPRRSTLKAWG